MTFPAGPGAPQSPIGDKAMRVITEDEAVQMNEPETDGPSDFERPQPTDPGGDNKAGWVKTADYGDGYYGVSSGPFRQV